MTDELIRLTAREAIRRVHGGEITPLDLIDAAERRIAECEPALNALPTSCFDRAREQRRRLMQARRARAGMRPAGSAACPSPSRIWPTWRACAPPTARRSSGIMCRRPRIPWSSASSARAASSSPSRTRRSSAPAARPSTRCSGAPATPGTPRSPAAARPAAARRRWRPARYGWRTARDHAGSLRRPATYCSVVGLRPSPGRVTRGTSNNLFAPLSVQGPMARNVPDVALFLDAMAGLCPRDPLTFDAPRDLVRRRRRRTRACPKRVAFTADFGGKVPMDRETREICAQGGPPLRGAGRRRRGGDAGPRRTWRRRSWRCARRPSSSIASSSSKTHRDLIKADIIWNTEQGLKATPSRLAWAERERAAFYRRVAAFFETYDLLVTPGASTPAFDVNLRMPDEIDGKQARALSRRLAHHRPTTLMGVPSLAVPCGFDRYGRPVGLQIVGRPRGEAALLAGRRAVRGDDGARPARADRPEARHGAARSSLSGLRQTGRAVR